MTTGTTGIFRFLTGAALALSAAGCASVKISMNDGESTAEVVRSPQRAQLSAALASLEEQPWVDASAARNDGLVTMIFGGGGPSPRVLAETYLESIEGTPDETALTVRRDVEDTLADAWRIAHIGREATRGSLAVKSDLRTLEAAIVETRACRLVYAETMTILAKRDGTVDRTEIRRMKEGYNQAILELGRTADALSSRLQQSPATSLAGTQRYSSISSN